MTKKKSSPTDEKSSALASRATPAKPTQKAQPTPQSAAVQETLARILAVLERVDEKLGALVPKPLEKL